MALMQRSQSSPFLSTLAEAALDILKTKGTVKSLSYLYVTLNDKGTHADVMKMFDDAIANLRMKND